LAEIEVALDRLDDVAPETKEEAKGLLRRLLGIRFSGVRAWFDSHSHGR
jgi:hypothetical protein